MRVSRSKETECMGLIKKENGGTIRIQSKERVDDSK